MLGSIIKLASSIRGLAIIISATSLIGLFSGWRAHAVIVAARHEKELVAQINKERELRRTAEETASSLSKALLEHKQRVIVKYRDIIKEVPTVVPDSSTCDLGYDFVRLFNRAARGELSASAPGNTVREVPGFPNDDKSNGR